MTDPRDTQPPPVGGVVELAERCEQATGPDRELDILIQAEIEERNLFFDNIGQVIGKARKPPHDACVMGRGKRAESFVKRYTASLDAAMTLVPEGCASAIGTMAFKDETRLPWAVIWTQFGEPRWRGNAKTPALALCAAALRARMEADR